MGMLRDEAKCERGGLVYSTYLGGGILATLARHCSGPAGNAYVTGDTESSNFG